MKNLLHLSVVLVALQVLAWSTTATAQNAEGEQEEEETPGPGSEESEAVEPLPPPPLRPPEGLELTSGSPGQRADHHSARADSLRRLTETLAASVEETGASCTERRSVDRLLGFVLDEAEAELRTAEAHAEGLSSEATRALRDFISESRELQDAQRTRALASARRMALACGVGPTNLESLPALVVPSPGRAGRAMLVGGTEASLVLWVDGVPRSVTGTDGWGVVVLSPGSHVLCRAAAVEAGCRGALSVDAAQAVVARF